MSKKNWTLLLLCMAFFTLTLVGCSSKDREVSAPSSATKDVTFNFSLQKDTEIVTKSLVPNTVAKFAFIGYQDETKVYPASEDYYVVEKAEVTEDGQLQSVTIPDVPITVNNFLIKYLATDDAVVAVTVVTEVNLTSAEPTEIKIGDEETPIVESSLIVKIAKTVEHPEEATYYNVALYDSTGKLIVATTPAAISDLKDVTFDETALNTTEVHLNWYDGEEILGYNTQDGEVPTMLPGQSEPYVVKIGGTFTPTRLKVSLTNCYKLQTAPKNGVKLIVTNDGKEKETSVAYSAEGKYALNLPMDEGEKLSITSIVLIDADTDTPFEWFDYSTPVTEFKADLNVEDNEFANGKFDAGKTMEVANPRQLDNIRNHRDAQDPEDPEDDTIDGNYKQIKDIDFAGSCGSTLKAAEMGAGPAYTYDLDNANKNARFFGDEDETLFGWVSIGGKNLINGVHTKISFIGTYDGNGYKISNLVMDNRVNAKRIVGRAGLFGQIKNGTLKNITLDNTCQFVADNCLGSICGVLMGNSTIENCQSSALVCCFYNFGGILGNNMGEGNINKCKLVGAQVIGLYNGPGEYYSTTMDYCANYSGIVGPSSQDGDHPTDPVSLNVTDCSCDEKTKISQIGDADTSIFSWNIGGIVGPISYGSASIKNCTNAASIFASSRVGGIVGTSSIDITLENCHNTGAITKNNGSSNGVFIAGLVGYCKNIPTFAGSELSNSTGAITVGACTGSNGVAGLIGKCEEDDADTIIAALKGHVGTPTKPTGDFADPHVYCGLPAIDSLDT